MGTLERVPLSLLLRRTGSNLSGGAPTRVSDDATPSPAALSKDATIFTARWPTVHRSPHHPLFTDAVLQSRDDVLVMVIVTAPGAKIPLMHESAVSSVVCWDHAPEHWLL